jgi:hypothetical protein
MDASSELVHSLLPAYMVTALGASVTSVGLIEGVAEATAMIVKVFSRTLSDLLGRRKLMTVVGYGLAAVTKPLFPLSDSMGLVLAARFIDRIGKGIRGAPRDALIGEIAPADLRGACFGLRQSLDTIGAFIGPSLAMIFMLAMADNVRAVLWIAVAPAFLAVAVVVFGVHEPASSRPADHARIPIRAQDLRRARELVVDRTVLVYAPPLRQLVGSRLGPVRLFADLDEFWSRVARSARSSGARSVVHSSTAAVVRGSAS